MHTSKWPRSKSRNQKFRISTLIAVKSALVIIPATSRRRFKLIVILQVALGLLDLVGVALIGAIGALAVRGVQSQGPGDRVSYFLRILNLENFSFQSQVAILGAAAVSILVLRTAFSIILQRRTLHFLSRRGAEISSLLLEKILGSSILRIQSTSKQDILFTTTTGVREVSLGIIGSAVSLTSDAALLLIMFFGLIVINPVIALCSFVLLFVLSLILNKILTGKSQSLGVDSYTLTIFSNQKIIETLNSFRELSVRGRKKYYAAELRKSRYALSRVEAELQFLPNVSKYSIESGVLIGTFILGAAQFMLLDASRAAATLAVFLAAGTRLAPAILRMQQSFLQLRASMGSAEKTLKWISELDENSQVSDTDTSLTRDYSGFVPSVELRNVSFGYPDGKEKAIKSISLDFKPGSVTGIVGGSGAGKTTLIDLVLGVLIPNEGEVQIGGLDPISAINKWPGGISYVPQDVSMIEGSVRNNVTLGYPPNAEDDDFIWKALEVAQLKNFISALPDGLETQVGDSGTRLSGGQRQRLGIARALFTSPKLLVLDEATSSLDGNLEAELSQAIQELRGEVTVILIAHRLSTLRTADKIAYLADGELISYGSIEKVKMEVPDFEKQANLMGL
jgi:ABC-type multidrug transport system fused ATPase/permease subunit